LPKSRENEGASRDSSSWRLAYALAWLPALGAYVTVYSLSEAPLSAAIRAGIATLLPCALFGAWVLAAAPRLPRPDRSAAFFAAQLLSLLLFVSGVVLGWLVLYDLDTRLRGMPFEVDARIIPWQGLMASFVYVAIAGVGQARASARRAREEAARAARAEALRARAELALLRTQVNPHFLLNTLHTMIGLVRREPALAETALERLGELLHYGLRIHRSDVDEISFGKEWEFVKSYLELEKLRLGERLRLTLEADAALSEQRVPPFVLQPLVENAITHAISPRASGGSLAVRATRRGDGGISIEVSDDGPGCPEEKLFSGDRLGLRLLRDRLAMLYNGAGRLTFARAPAGGLAARIDLPASAGGASGA
jgi:sensor histidine kinase YesM